MKYLISAAVVLTLCACTTQTLHTDVLRAHAERNCRVEATVNHAYAIDSTGVSLKNVAYSRCMSAHGFVSAE